MKYLISILLLIISLKSNSQILNLSFFSELMKLNNKSEMLLKLAEKNYIQNDDTRLKVTRFNKLDIKRDSTYEIWLFDRGTKDEKIFSIGLITSDSLFANNLENEIKKEYILEKNNRNTTKKKSFESGLLMFKDTKILLNIKPYTYENGTNKIRVKKNFKIVTNYNSFSNLFTKNYKVTKNKFYEFIFFKNLK
jgi:hypothetical protein